MRLPPDRPRHGLHANCGGVAGLRRPCAAKEGGGGVGGSQESGFV